MRLKVLDIKGQETGREVDLIPEIFGVDINEHSVYLSIKQYLANRRQGTHKSKEKSEVNRSTRKIKKQKGTGGARAGSLKSPLFKGGGRVFGPKPRNYSFKLNKKVKLLARKSVLTQKAKENNIKVIEDFNLPLPKTKNFIEILNNLEINKIKSLFIMSNDDKNVYLSSRNIKGMEIGFFKNINTYSILNSEKLIITEGALKLMQEFKSV